MGKLRDLFIGIVLNLTCNIDNSELTKHMIDKAEMIELLLQILVDSRQDWPTCGAALALLQYSHVALSSNEMYMNLLDNEVPELIALFMEVCKNRDARKNIAEALYLLQICN